MLTVYSCHRADVLVNSLLTASDLLNFLIPFQVTKIATNIILLDSRDQLDSKSHEILLSFYQQVIHHPIKFTAFGLYSINLQLLASIITGVVSYQVILIQFYAT
jgi:7tm Chemosensory receptor